MTFQFFTMELSKSENGAQLRKNFYKGMLNVQKQQENGNVFKQFASWRSGRLANVSEARARQLINTRNDDTNADEAMIVVKAIAFICTAICAYCGYLCYLDTFSSAFSPTMAFVFALSLPVAVELGKLFLAQKSLRSIFFGWMFKDYWSLGMWLFVLILAGLTYVWSFTISTEGLAMMTRNHSEASTAKISLQEHLNAATADIDAQITNQQGVQDKSLASKYKGTIVYEAQKTATAAGKNITALQAQRAAILDAATLEWKEMNGTRAGKISAFSEWIKAYGGYMEWIVFFCLICNGFFERKTALANLDAEEKNHPTPSTGGNDEKRGLGRRFTARMNGLKYQPQGNINSKPSQNSTQPAPIRGTAVAHVAQEATIHTDDALKLAHSELRKEIYNLNAGNGELPTIAGRANAIFNRIANYANQNGFDPSGKAIVTYYNSMEECCNLLKEKGRAYEYEQQHKKQMSKFLPDTKPAGYNFEDVEGQKMAS